MTDSEVPSPNNSVAGGNSKNFDFYDDPLFLSSSDQPFMQLLGYMFNGHNFISWKRDSYHALISKNKEGFVDGSVKQPDKTDKRYHQWIRCDLMVMKWLLNSIEPHIRDTVQYVSSSKEIWTELVERYGQTNTVEIYQLRRELSDISQENAPLIEYYSKLKKTWESVNHLDPIPTCTCGALDLCSCKMLKRVVDRDTNSKLLQFLMGLNSGYENVKTHIISMEPLPSINKALSLLQKIERQKQVSDAIDVLAEANAYVAQQSFSQPDSKKQKLSVDTTPKVCSHCNQRGHIKEDCFKLKDCAFCGRRGHIKEHCFQLRDNRSVRGRGKPFFRGGSNVYKRSAHSAHTDAVHIGQSDDDLGLTDPLTPDTASHGPAPNNFLGSEVVTGIVNTVVQEVMKAFGDASGTHSVTSFSGPFK